MIEDGEALVLLVKAQRECIQPEVAVIVLQIHKLMAGPGNASSDLLKASDCRELVLVTDRGVTPVIVRRVYRTIQVGVQVGTLLSINRELTLQFAKSFESLSRRM